MQSKAGPAPAAAGDDRDKLWPRVDPTLPTPLYHQVFMTLLEKIRRGDFGASGALPSDQEIAERMDVSRITVKRALQELVTRKMVIRGRGRGTVVAENNTIPIVRGTFDGLTGSVVESGHETKIDLLEALTAPAPGAVARRLEVAADTPLYRSKWRRRVDGQPFSFFTSYVPQAVADQYGLGPHETTPFALLLQNQGHDRLISGQWVSAVAAEPEVATVLAVDIGFPVLRIERLLHDPQGDPVEYLMAYYRSDRFDWHIRSEGPFVGTVVDKLPDIG